MIRILICICLLSGLTSFGQNLSVGIAYQYQKAFEWEKMINNYNSNSPWLVENQPYLNASVSTNLQYVFDSKSIFHHGAGFNYIWSRSYADNVDSTNRLDMHQFTLGYILEIHNEEKLKNFFFDFGFNYSFMLLPRKTEFSDPLKQDYNRSKMGSGGNFDFKFGYKLAFGPNAWLSPFIGAGYTYSRIGDLWIFFQTDGLNYLDYHFVYAKVGVQIEFRLPRVKKEVRE